ncbi:MAG: hypothetical protein FWG34_05855 [Oscillospiraceae bacterium]|nr:hypothetical protein [Oscillospiraceae bacterium]
MKSAKRCKLLVLAAIFSITAIFASCGDGKENADKNNTGGNPENSGAAPEETTQAEYSDFPDAKMDGRIFVIMNPEYSLERHFYTAEEETGDSLNDAAYKRNAKIEDQFDISIKTHPSETECYTTLNKLVASGDDSVDLVVTHPNYVTSLITNGLLRNWLDMKYVDFSKPCWNADMQDTFKINGKIFYAAGDITITSIGQSVILFNKEMMQNLSIENPYQHVFAGTWTIDKLMEFIKGASRDTNGNGTIDKDDIFGYVSNASDYAYLWASGLKVAQIDKDGKPALSLLGDRLALVINKSYELIHGADTYIEKDYQTSFHHFEDGRSLAISWDIGTYWMNLRPVEFDFGIAPLPKLDEMQENYYSFVAAGLMGIPVNAKDPDDAGIIIQAYAEGSYRYLRPAFFGNVLYNKCLQDEESQKILEMIQLNKVYDIGFSFDSQKILPYIISETVVQKKSTDFVSFYEKHADRAQADFDLIYDITG